MSLVDIAAQLYALPLAEFTPARDAKARELKGTPEAAQVKALRKPSTAAWAVNLLVRLETEQVDQMLALGAALRAAQAGLDAAQLRALATQRRRLTAEITARARVLARERGLRVTDAVAEQVEQTLTAAMLDENAAAAVHSGLLVGTLVATGFSPVDVAASVALPEALGHAAAPAPRELYAVPSPPADPEAITEAADRVRAAAEDALAAARRGAAAAHAAHDKALRRVERQQARSLQLQAELDELRRRIADLEETARRADDDLADAEGAQHEAATEVAHADDALGEAERALAQLDH